MLGVREQDAYGPLALFQMEALPLEEPVGPLSLYSDRSDG